MAKAFLSHSSSDKPLVEKIALQLGVNNCHIDSLTFEAGKKTIDEIFNGLADTDIFVLFISELALESDWVKKEMSSAKTMLDKRIIDRIFPLIIDRTIKYNDPRIPNWIKKPYNIKYFDNEVLILKKIRQFLRESNFKKYSHLRDLDDLFVGRAALMDDFEKKMVNIDNRKPSCIISNSYFEGVGRRTFLKNALVKTKMIDKWYEPILVPINTKESIEDFIYKLNFVEPDADIFKHDFTKLEIDKKIDLAKKLIKKFVSTGELIFIVDEGSIVLPNTQIVDWFKKLIKDPELDNQLSICLISKFKPNSLTVRKLGNVLAFQIDELSRADTQILFIQYLKIIGVSLPPEDIRFFLSHVSGVPGQVIYASNLIASSGISEAKKYIKDIEEYDELSALSILDFFKDDELGKQILIAFSKFEVISYDLAYKIFGENEEVYKSVQRIFDLSLLYKVSAAHEYLKLTSSISDYIRRSTLELNPEYQENLNNLIKESLSKPLELEENTDYSDFLLTLQMMIKNGKTIPSKYFIPSFILKSIVQEYYERRYQNAIDLAGKILENRDKYDEQIIRETRYWICLSYCRTENEKFFDEVKYFHSNEMLKDYYFLLGFYFRNTDKVDSAEEYFNKVLEIDGEHSRTKRELVNVYLRKHNYSKALSLAESTYKSHRSNILHIQAYFTCLIKKNRLSEEDKQMLQYLLASTKKSIDKKAEEMYRTMLGEYEFYVSGNLPNAIRILEDAIKINSNKYFAFKALSEIYKRSSLEDAQKKLLRAYPDMDGFYDED